MKLIRIALFTAIASMAAIPAAFAQQGPVASACASDIQKYCKDVPHANRAARNCLEAKRDDVSASCRQALDLTGPGRGGCGGGRGCGRGNNAK